MDWIVVSLTPTEKGPFARKLMGAVGDGDRAIDVQEHPHWKGTINIYLINRLAGSQSVALAKRPFFPC